MRLSRVVPLGLLCAAVLTPSLLGDVSLTETRNLQSERQAAKLKAKSQVQGNKKARGGAPGVLATGSQPLIDGSGLEWFINTDITFSTSSSASGAVSEASYTHSVAATTSAGGTTSSKLNDAYDGYNAMCVSLTNSTDQCEAGNSDFVIYNKNGPATTECVGPVSEVNRQVVLPVQTIGPLHVQRKMFVPDNDSFARWMNIFTNTSGAPVTFTMITSNNLGSDNNTIIVSSSNGDAVAQTSDTWVTTFQNFTGKTTSDPRLGHVFQGPGAPVPLSFVNFTNGDDNPWWGYQMTLAPGQTNIIINFGVAQPTRAASNTKSAQLATFPTAPNSTQCMSPTELSEVVNFVVTADLSIVKTAPGSVPPSAPIAYALDVNNGGPLVASNVSVADTLPAGVTFVSASGTGWACSQAAGTVTCTVGSLPLGPAPTITINVNAPATPGPITNTATVSSSTPDGNIGNNTASATTTVSAGPSVSGTKDVSGSFMPNGLIQYTIVLTNSGGAAQMDNPGNEFTDVLPSSLSLQSVTSTSGVPGANIGTNTASWNGSLAAGASVTIVITARISPTASGVVSNQGTIAFDADDNGTNESTALTSAVGGLPNSPTVFTVVAAPVSNVPTLDSRALLLLAAFLAGASIWLLRRN